LADPRLASRDRRNFLIHCCQALSATLVPACLRNFAFAYDSVLDSSDTGPAEREFYLHPHYRAKLPIEATLLKVQAGNDEFITEKYADQISAMLNQWSAGLQRDPTETTAIDKVLSSNFSGCSFTPTESRVVRPGPLLEARQNKFASEPVLGRAAFLQNIKSAMKPFSKIFTAEFQVVAIEAIPLAMPDRLRTRVRYELVGSGQGFHREQRVGEWELEWEAAASRNDFRLRSWRAFDETRSRSAEPVFADIATATLGRNTSYSSQLLHGADHWRTVLDVASGIDIYGHNGVSIGDIDNDGFDDLYVCQAAGLPNRLYRNRRDGTFEDITETAGVGVLDDTACALFADIDNDGRQDLIVVCQSAPLLFLNQGGGKFQQKVDAFRFANPPQGTFAGAAMADYDRDGWLDIYFCLYLYYRGTEQFKSPSPFYDAQNGPPNFLMRNQRDGTFRDVTAETGLDQNNRRYSFCCGWSDYNHDGWPDLCVVNDFGRKNLYRNHGDGTFTDVAPEAGVEDVGAGMSVSWLDYDGDGHEDLYIANMWTAAGRRISTQDSFQKDAPEEVRALYRKHAMGNSLFRNNDHADFENRSLPAGVEMGRWSWSSDAWDFDHDGFPDLYVTNGMVSGESREDLNSFFWRQVVARSPAEGKPADDYEQGWDAINQLIRSDGTWSGFERNVFYANNRDGTFSDVSGVVGMDFIEDGRSFALSDFDHDGRQEVFLKNRNGPQLRVLKNVMKNLPPSIAFNLRGTKSNRDAIGAVVTVKTESRSQTRSLQAGSGFISQHSKELFFGLGDAKAPVRASIRWPSGLVQEIQNIPLNHRVWVEEGSSPSRFEAFQVYSQTFRANENSAPSMQPGTMKPEPLPREAETWLLAPVSAPDFSLPDLAGQVHALASLRGRPVLLNFSTTVSPVCGEELNVLNQAHKRLESQGLQLLTVNLDDPPDPAKLRARARPLSFPVLAGSEDVAAVYNILYRQLFDRHRDLGFPTSFLIDAGGDIVKVYQGAVDPKRLGEDVGNIPQTDVQRLALALPFSGLSSDLEYRRNYFGFGLIYFQRGYYEQSEAWFQLALKDDPSNAEAHYGLGSVYLKQERNSEAKASFELTVQLKSNYAMTLTNAWNNLGLLAARQGNMTEAISHFQEALRLDPNHVVALDNLGAAYRQQQNWDEARKTLERALKVKPDDAEANYSLGMVYAQTDDSERAYEFLQKALQLRPDYPEALNNLGILYLRMQRTEQAVATFEECVRVAPAFSRCYMDLAHVYAVEGMTEKARTVLLQLLKQHPDHAQAQKALQQLSQ
jgi:tetratricopeptide (TPR) repeat protein/peroxiredoxin